MFSIFHSSASLDKFDVKKSRAGVFESFFVFLCGKFISKGVGSHSNSHEFVQNRF
jgi:hypothetical protein